MISAYETKPLDFVLMSKDLADSHGGTIAEMRDLFESKQAQVLSFFDEDTIQAMLAITYPNDKGVCDLCTLYSNDMMNAPLKSVKAAIKAMNAVAKSSNVRGFQYAIPMTSVTGPRFSALLGFEKVGMIGANEIYFRGV